MKRPLGTLALAATATASLVLAAIALGAAGDVVLVSGPNGKTEAGFPVEHIDPSISADGRFVAFVGSLGETGEGIYLRDLNGGTTAVNAPSGHSEQGIDFAAVAPSLSGSGRYLAFASEDPGLSDEDRDSDTTPAGYTYPVRDVFVYDRASGAIGLVSRRSGPEGAAANNDSNSPSISADGRYVAFGTQATNFLRGVFGGLFVRDLRTKQTVMVGRADGPRGEPLRTAIIPSISAHGRWVAFVTTLHLQRRGRATLEVAVRDIEKAKTRVVSRASGGRGAVAGEDATEPSISANGRYVAFATKARNLSGVDKGSVEDVFVRDLKTNRTTLASRAVGRRGAAGNGDSSNPSISAGGRFVAFESYASNLGPADNGSRPDVFVRDLRSGRVFLASRAGGGGPAADAASANPSISGDGRYVAFDSRASNLSPADTLHDSSVFRYQLLP
jgi:Tol biopolymer transport system component